MRTAPQKNMGTAELDAEIKCVRPQIKLGQDAGRDTAALQNELSQLEERRASDKSTNTKLAEQLRVIRQCETKISATSTEIARLRSVLLEKEDELEYTCRDLLHDWRHQHVHNRFLWRATPKASAQPSCRRAVSKGTQSPVIWVRAPSRATAEAAVLLRGALDGTDESLHR